MKELSVTVKPNSRVVAKRTLDRQHLDFFYLTSRGEHREYLFTTHFSLSLWQYFCNGRQIYELYNCKRRKIRAVSERLVPTINYVEKYVILDQTTRSKAKDYSMSHEEWDYNYDRAC